MHFDSFTNFGGVSSDPWAEPDLILSIQELTSSSQISGKKLNATVGENFEGIAILWDIFCHVCAYICKVLA